MAERWVSAFEYEGLYEVSSIGRVRRIAGSPRCRVARFIKPVPLIHRDGYLCVSLWRENRGLMRRLNRLVFQSFHGKIERHIDVHHKDEVVENNKLSNLIALTKKEHAAVSSRRVGSECHNAVLSEAQVKSIKKMYRRGVRGFGYRTLSARFVVRPEYIRDIIKGKTWKHVQVSPR